MLQHLYGYLVFRCRVCPYGVSIHSRILINLIREEKAGWLIIQPPHDKTNTMTVRPAKTQINLGIHPVWSASSLCDQWEAKDPNFLRADSEDSDQNGRIPRLIWVFAGRTCHFVTWNCKVSSMCRRLFIIPGTIARSVLPLALMPA